MILFADTNILLDLMKIRLLEEFFAGKHEVCIEISVFEDELISPSGIQKVLLTCGLQCIDMTNDEFILAQKTKRDKPKLSFYDCVAYAVAKIRGWTLLTGDRRLRKHAEENRVVVHGLLWSVHECEKNGTKPEHIQYAVREILDNPKIHVSQELVYREFEYMLDCSSDEV